MLLNNPELREEPRQISSLVAWWDFSDDALMSFSGTNISTLADKCSTGANLQFESGLVGRPYHAQPANSINGRPAAGFAGDQEQTMRTVGDSAALRFGTGQFSIVVVFKCSDTDRSTMVHRGDSTAFYNLRVNDADSDDGKGKATTKSTAAVVGSVSSADEDFADNSVYVLTMLRDSSDYLRLYTNNTEVTESPDTTAGGDLDPTGTHYVWVGSDKATDQWFAGKIGDVFLFNDELSSDEREYLHRFLRKKWSI